MKEYQLQKAICQYLDLKGVLYCGSMGGQYQKFHSQRNKAKATGYKKGFPDLFLYEPRGSYHGLGIELKIKYNKPTGEQLGWIKRLTDNGYLACVCYGIDEALGIIDKYLEL
jgi:hypothetical protein|tara:strand:- start:18 stop:353 length:336 start_codon:yes stop_codon:yes gene_type:complete